MIQLNRKEKEWVEKAAAMEKSRMEIKMALHKANYPNEKIDACIEYYDLIKDTLKGTEAPEPIIENKKLEESFRKMTEGKGNELGFWEKRELNKFIKSAKLYSNVMKKAIEQFIKETELIKRKFEKNDRSQTEIEHLKMDIIDRIIESKGILEIEHPITGEEVTKENLKELDINQLTELMQENVDALDNVVNGKLTELEEEEK